MSSGTPVENGLALIRQARSRIGAEKASSKPGRLAKIVNGADTDNSLWNQPEAAGWNALAEGFRHLGYSDDHELAAAEAIG
jgi:hypothetical protein